MNMNDIFIYLVTSCNMKNSNCGKEKNCLNKKSIITLFQWIKNRYMLLVLFVFVCVTLLSLTSTLCLLCMLYTLTTWCPPQGHVKVTEVFLSITSQTLDNADASKTPSDMMSLLCLLTSGRNLDFILAVASSTGKLLGLASKLVK